MSEEIRKLAEQACGTSKDSPEYARFISSINPTLLLDLTAAQSEMAALREELLRLEEEYDTLEHANITLKLSLADTERRNATRDIESAAKVLANCMDYPWEHMPENGRTLMRKHAKCIVDAALAKPTESGASE